MKTLLRIVHLPLVALPLLIGGCAAREESVQIEPKSEPVLLSVRPQPVPSVPQPVQPEPPPPPEPRPIRPIAPPVAATDAAPPAETIAPPKPEAPVQAPHDQSITIVGTIQYVELEGGFFGIVTEEGTKYFPQYLPFDFKVDGLPVRVDAMPEEQAIGIQMWGLPIKIIRIRPG